MCNPNQGHGRFSSCVTFNIQYTLHTRTGIFCKIISDWMVLKRIIQCEALNKYRKRNHLCIFECTTECTFPSRGWSSLQKSIWICIWSCKVNANQIQCNDANLELGPIRILVGHKHLPKMKQVLYWKFNI